jgi:hypothetical protein
LAGLIERDTGTGGLTVSVVEPETDPEVAEIVVVPAQRALASPAELMLATLRTDELHPVDWVTSCVEPSL